MLSAFEIQERKILQQDANRKRKYSPADSLSAKNQHLSPEPPVVSRVSQGQQKGRTEKVGIGRGFGPLLKMYCGLIATTVLN